MRKTRIHFEQVPVEEAEKILKQEKLLAKRDGNRKLLVKKSGRTLNGPPTIFKKPEVPAA
jgi:hypothetical protein